MNPDWLDPRGSLLGEGCPLPLADPFTTSQAHRLGVSRRTFQTMVALGLVRPVVRGVYAVAQAPDDVVMRASAIGLVLPPTAVVCDRTAAWLHGVDVLPRTARTVAPPLDVVHSTDTRMDRPGVDGRRRGLLARDVTEVNGIRVTTPLRTALDLGRLLWRYDALAALDAFVRAGVLKSALLLETGRFRGYRGVVQLRALGPIANGGAESLPESGLRLHWLEAGLPQPEVQWWVYDDDGTALFRFDLADPDAGFAAEYDGEELHTEEGDREHDLARRAWLEDRGWTIEVFTKADLYGRGASPAGRLQAGHARARRTPPPWSPGRRLTGS